jgi:hypothetical protein
MINLAAGDYGRFMAGYCSNLPSSFRLVYAAKKTQWQVWHLFSKLSHKEVEKRKKAKKAKRVGITIGISCHTCHAFSVFSLGKRFRPIATCHLTCHDLAAGELAEEGEIETASFFVRQTKHLFAPRGEGG